MSTTTASPTGGRWTHAVLRPVAQDMRTGEWESGVRTLCGLAPWEVTGFSTQQRFVSCPNCREHTDFQVLPAQIEQEQVTRPTTAALSANYSDPSWRAGPGRVPAWRTIRTAEACDECAMVQHEAGGATGSLCRRARHRRSIPGDRAAALRLCTAHKAAWQARDAADTTTPRRRP